MLALADLLHFIPDDNDSPEKVAARYAQAWALTHYLIMRDSKEKTHRMTDLLALLAKGVDQKEAAKQTIGDSRPLETELRAYVQKSEFRVASVAPQRSMRTVSRSAA